MATGEFDRSELILALERLNGLKMSKAAWMSVLHLLERLDTALVGREHHDVAQLTEKLLAVSSTSKRGKPPPVALRRQVRKIAVEAIEAKREEVWDRALAPGVLGAMLIRSPKFVREARFSSFARSAPSGGAHPGTAARWEEADPHPRRMPSARVRHHALPHPGDPVFVDPDPPPDPPPPEPERVDVTLGARMPARVALGDTVVVNVAIGREDLETRGANEVGATDRASADPEVPIVLRLLPQRGFEVKGKDLKHVVVPAVGNPAKVKFRVTAVHASPGEVWVTVDQSSIPLALLKLRTEILGDGTTSATTAEATATTVAGGALPPYKRLKITEKVVPGQGVVYEYDIELPDVPWQIHEQLIPGDREQYVAGLYGQLEDWARKPGDAENLLENMRSFGVMLFKQLFPKELRELLWENRDELSGVMVLSTEPFIPWELVHLMPPDDVLPSEPQFLGQKGVVRWLYGSRPPTALSVRRNRCRYVIPQGGDLDETAVEREMLERLGAEPIEPRLTEVRQALAEEDGFDLLHFAGHAEADGRAISMAKVLLDPPANSPWSPSGQPPPPDPLFASVVESHGRFGSKDHRPMIVLNACQSGRSGMQLTSLGGFAEAFLQRQAGAFVGTLWAVGDKPAMTFVEALYQRLMRGDTFSVATASAREQARAAGDPTWLAYAVYAWPDATVEWTT